MSKKKKTVKTATVSSTCETTLSGFFKRLLYKFSGAKIVSFMLSGASIIALVLIAKIFSGKISDEIVLSAMSAIKELAIGLFIVRGAQNVTEVITGRKGGENGN